ncbi:STAS domain-containing protein [Gordonia sp. SID5947]|nr:STAS domain-containing protein [Gordonia sp. SID5947]
MQRFSGDIDMQTIADLAAALDRVLGRKPDCVVLDLSRVHFLSASGLAILSQFGSDAADQAIPVAVVAKREVARPIEACGLVGVLPIYASVEEAGSDLTESRSH